MVQAEGLEAVFECLYQAELPVTYDWFINGGIHHLDTPDVSSLLPLTPDATATLRIAAIPGHNNTVVQCEVDIRNGTERRLELSSIATLTVYGV